ncbi:MAG: hypothetical protein QM831_17205 [Kofleriaceae bacterium]
MRSLVLVLVSGCAIGGSNKQPEAPASVHDRLSAEPTRLFISGQGSTGELMAQRKGSDGSWISGTSDLSIANGELFAQADDTQMTASKFDLQLNDIDLPESVFGKPAQLQNVRVVLAKAASGAVTWTDDDSATATLPMQLDLSWAIEIDGTSTQLGAQHFPEFPLDVTLTGGGDHVDATFGLHAQGTLWSWAGLVQLTELDLSLVGATVE